MKNLKNQKGITLVALVVTIIVLLILAGVSLSLVAGSNGIMTKATSASDSSVTATAREQTELLLSQLSTDYYDERYVQLVNTAQNQSAGQYICTKLTTSGMNTSSNKFKVKYLEKNDAVELKDNDTNNTAITYDNYFHLEGKTVDLTTSTTTEATAGEVVIEVSGDSLKGVGTAEGNIYALLSYDGQITEWFDANHIKLKN